MQAIIHVFLHESLNAPTLLRTVFQKVRNLLLYIFIFTVGILRELDCNYLYIV